MVALSSGNLQKRCCQSWHERGALPVAHHSDNLSCPIYGPCETSAFCCGNVKPLSFRFVRSLLLGVGVGT